MARSIGARPGRGKPPGLRVARLASLFDEPLQPLRLEVDGSANDSQVPPAFMQLIVVGLNTLCVFHVLMFDGPDASNNPW